MRLLFCCWRSKPPKVLLNLISNLHLMQSRAARGRPRVFLISVIRVDQW